MRLRRFHISLNLNEPYRDKYFAPEALWIVLPFLIH